MYNAEATVDPVEYPNTIPRCNQYPKTSMTLIDTRDVSHTLPAAPVAVPGFIPGARIASLLDCRSARCPLASHWPARRQTSGKLFVPLSRRERAKTYMRGDM
ncbi:Protein of unknown function [Gryllus bimaculatus]|nr:Protein of unknown function [Gryllus bimaculatus]